MPLKARAKLYWVLEILREHGLGVGRPYVAPLADGLWELRVRHQGVNHRFLFFLDRGKAVFTHGFTKKTDKVPKGEMEIARRIREEYYRAKER
jgi:phage-related protein